MNNNEIMQAFKESAENQIIVKDFTGDIYRVTLYIADTWEPCYENLAESALNQYDVTWTAYNGNLLNTQGPAISGNELDSLLADPEKFVLPVKMTESAIIETSRETADFFGIADKADEIEVYASLSDLNASLFCDQYYFGIEELDKESGEYMDMEFTDYFVADDCDNMASNLSNSVSGYEIITQE